MKRLTPSIIPFLLFVCCAVTQGQTGSDAKHIGAVKLVGKSKLDGIKTMALASSLDSLLISDGTIISKQDIDLEILSLTDFERTASFKITDAMSGGYPWSSSSLVIAPDGSKALLYNQYIDLNKVGSIATLDIRPVIGRPNVRPEPWSISPNGKIALACVGSYWSRDESTLATFDLESGKFIKKIATGKNIEYGTACFLDNETVLTIGYDGKVTIHNQSDATAETMPEKFSLGSIQEGTNLRLQPFNDGKNIVVSGNDEILIIDIQQRKFLFRYQSKGGNAVLTKDGKFLLWQTNRVKKKEKETDYLLLVANIHTGKILGEYMLPTFYQMILVDDSSEFIYAASYNELHKLKVDLTPFTKK